MFYWGMKRSVREIWAHRKVRERRRVERESGLEWRENEGLVKLLWASVCNRDDNLHKTFDDAIVVLVLLKKWNNYRVWNLRLSLYNVPRILPTQRCRFQFYCISLFLYGSSIFSFAISKKDISNQDLITINY